MALIAILLALFLDRYASSLAEWRRWEWFFRYCDWMQRRFSLRSIPGVLFLLFWPLLLAAWLYHWFAGAWALDLLVSTAILYYSLGPLNLRRQVAQWQEMSARGDLQGSYRVALAIRQGEVAESREGIEQAVVEGILLQANERLLAVLFWFVVLGPVGALLYRMSSLTECWAGREYAGHDLAQAAQRLHDILAWVPARLCALSFALSGNFVGALSHWADKTAMIRDHYTRILLACGRGAMTGTHPGQGGPVDEVLSLVFRAEVIWIVVLALMTLGGWIR